MNGKSTPMGQSLESLPPEQRAERYRQFAADAIKKAQDSQESDRRAEFLGMAAGWHTMAVEAERLAALRPPGEAGSDDQASRTAH